MKIKVIGGPCDGQDVEIDKALPSIQLQVPVEVEIAPQKLSARGQQRTTRYWRQGKTNVYVWEGLHR